MSEMVQITLIVPRAEKEAAHEIARRYRRSLQDVLGPSVVRRLQEYCKTPTIEPYPDEPAGDEVAQGARA